MDELAQAYEAMLGHGFREEHVQQALQVRRAPLSPALFTGHGVDV